MAESSASGEKTVKYEYLDHTADVQLHAWGDNLKEAFEQVATAMFGYMTDLCTVDIVRVEEITAEVAPVLNHLLCNLMSWIRGQQGDDMLGLLFHFLDELLFLMCADPYFIVKEVEILQFDRENFKIRAVGRGEEFDLSKHPQGTEVKAITYSNMQIHDTEDKHEVYVIIDI